jgi:hypothetical protein
MINSYKNEIENQYKVIQKYNIPYTTKCKFKTFSDPNSAQACYNNNCFYLNIHNYKGCKKYEVRTLTMHEAYPGHHLQQDISQNFSSTGYLEMIYSAIYTSFQEGWGLFAESIRNESNTISDLESDIGQYDHNLLRILRIIVDIDLHLNNRSPDEMIQYMSTYLFTDKITIEQEVYRYVVFPAQACCYKIGETVFMKIYREELNREQILNREQNQSNISTKLNKQTINSKYMWNVYKTLLLDGPIHIKLILDKYNLTFNI